MVRSGLFGKDSGGAVPLVGVSVSAEVLAGHACAVVRQRYRNDETKPIEAVYTFPLPSRGVLTAFSMSVGGRELVGEVQEREEAFRKYDDAITRGDGAALLEQERPNVFTANVGNLLPGEETVIEIRYAEIVAVEEGAVRWSVPTLVAPRYIPGTPTGDRTAHGVADPTDRVPDADRISPPIGAVSYGLELDVTFDLGAPVDVESPSHAVTVSDSDGKTRVRFAQKDVPLDRDVVLCAAARAGAAATTPISGAVCHRVAGSGNAGVVALTIVPDLAAGPPKAGGGARGNEVVFVLDRSGSMGGASMPQARTALRLCLRQLREGDRFAILAFDETIEAFAPGLVPFTQATLERANRWLASVDARGGTELLTPMLEAAKLAPDGIILLLTDGEVGNEDEILKAFLGARRTARVYSFGIGTNVSDALLHSFADHTGGAVESIYPGERIDEKVVAQFARATAGRVTDVTIKMRGIDLAELSPSEARPLVDGEPYCLFATYEEPGRGAVEIRGKVLGEPFYLEVPVDLAETADRPAIAKLWAQARIRDLERATVTGRRADAMKDRIVKLAIEHGVSSKFTSFVVVEKRTADRRATEQAETRVVPVNAPHGWSMFGSADASASKTRAGALPPGGMRMYQAVARSARASMSGSGAAMPPPGAPPPRAMPAPAAALRAPSPPPPSPAIGGAPPPAAPSVMKRLTNAVSSAFAPPRPKASGPAGFDRDSDTDRPPASGNLHSLDEDRTMARFSGARAPAQAEGSEKGSGDPLLALLARQAASGLWESAAKDAVAETVEALLVFLRHGVTTAHAVYGAQLKKAVDALLRELDSDRTHRETRLRELAFGVAWLLASGRRTRQTIEDSARGSGCNLGVGGTSSGGNEGALRARVETLAQP